jgi:mannose-1-phosphate guanylyltransferase
VIPAGGAGTRLWPRSRRSRPKHLLAPPGGRSLLALAYERVSPLTEHVHVLTEARQASMVLEALPGLQESGLILEPVARGTTSALGLAALTIAEDDPHAVIVSTAADQVVTDVEGFQEALRRAAHAADVSRSLVTVALRPAFPATGYGYIEAREPASGLAGVRVADRFVEKPDLETARNYAASAAHFWNLNLFAWRAEVFLGELRRLAPEHHDGLVEVHAARRRGDEQAAAELYARLPEAAVDYVVLERTDRLLVVPAEFGWSDVGTWSEMHRVAPKDRSGNASEGELVAVDSSGCLVSAPGRLVALVGVRDLVVVESDGAILVMARDRAEEVRRVVDALKRGDRLDYL